eukprot:4714427-Ditylum_brightwellii.AAC.1
MSETSTPPSTLKKNCYHGYGYSKKISYYCMNKNTCGCKAKIYWWHTGNWIEVPPTNVHMASCKLKNIGKPDNDEGFMDAEVKEGAVQDCTEFMKMKTDDFASEDLVSTPEQIWSRFVMSVDEFVGSNTWRGLYKHQ